MLTDERNGPEEVATTTPQGHPGSDPDHIGDGEAVEAVPHDSRDQGNKGPDERNEATKGDRPEAVAVKKLTCLDHPWPLQLVFEPTPV